MVETCRGQHGTAFASAEDTALSECLPVVAHSDPELLLNCFCCTTSFKGFAMVKNLETTGESKALLYSLSGAACRGPVRRRALGARDELNGCQEIMQTLRGHAALRVLRLAGPAHTKQSLGGWSGHHTCTTCMAYRAFVVRANAYEIFARVKEHPARSRET